MDLDPAIFVLDLQDANKKLFFCVLLLKVHIYIIFAKTKSQKEVTKQEESSFFLLFLLNDRRIQSRIQIRTSDYQIQTSDYQIREALKHPGPQHCRKFISTLNLGFVSVP
jgi:hypothetical protein